MSQKAKEAQKVKAKACMAEKADLEKVGKEALGKEATLEKVEALKKVDTGRRKKVVLEKARDQQQDAGHVEEHTFKPTAQMAAADRSRHLKSTKTGR